jgi:hypothetical protein
MRKIRLLKREKNSCRTETKSFELANRIIRVKNVHTINKKIHKKFNFLKIILVSKC